MKNSIFGFISAFVTGLFLVNNLGIAQTPQDEKLVNDVFTALDNRAQKEDIRDSVCNSVEWHKIFTFVKIEAYSATQAVEAKAPKNKFSNSDLMSFSGASNKSSIMDSPKALYTYKVNWQTSGKSTSSYLRRSSIPKVDTFKRSNFVTNQNIALVHLKPSQFLNRIEGFVIVAVHLASNPYDFDELERMSLPPEVKRLNRYLVVSTDTYETFEVLETDIKWGLSDVSYCPKQMIEQKIISGVVN